ncbi:MAG: biopolymer transporter ExbD [Burkholderiales bacterium]|jgi:biopolymer transport protein ExbD|uniref:Biopolymer transporter ExbD n=1 Tax=Candidatus Desulfobacillus denitrificans TaxID=2608985 RepID=A0A809R1N4_9PROT|nr:Biopolymer transport protein ExbD [Rhodocyclaceae bacterium]MCZ2420207.1 biopolymer transporter ExbD [Burkholderiales bacterium]BBO21509.1 biopolymer transporter ExbD [Candidatus Desulfobacillus denitrificans]GIK47156.1 MAG: biopolymer transporter [Betaproteobacteria bacterium]MCL4723418.1 biopolymer transporter ExbD [Rhodocyclaceae bacterium]
MSFGTFSDSDPGGDLTEINMIPLIDVMLVLLVIFIVTAPLLTHAVKVDLPKASSAPNLTRPENVQLAIDAQGRVYWNGEAVDAGVLEQHIKAAAALNPQPELHLRAERSTPYEKVAELMSAAAREGLTKIGFVTEPKR